jgi:hypothetical protein
VVRADLAYLVGAPQVRPENDALAIAGEALRRLRGLDRRRAARPGPRPAAEGPAPGLGRPQRDLARVAIDEELGAGGDDPDAPTTAVTAGIPSARARMAAWLVVPPTSVTTAVT